MTWNVEEMSYRDIEAYLRRIEKQKEMEKQEMDKLRRKLRRTMPSRSRGFRRYRR